MKRKLLTILLLCIAIGAMAKVELPALGVEGVVLQQQINNTIRGAENQTISLKTSSDSKTYTTKRNSQREFAITMQTPRAKEFFFMEFSDGEVLRLNDILIGELWLCSGKSNREMPVKGFRGQPVQSSLHCIAKIKAEVTIRGVEKLEKVKNKASFIALTFKIKQ